MSIEAIRWAFAQQVSHSSAKFVLVALADYAGPTWQAYPSVAEIARATGQDRKTVLANIRRLSDCGLISDTGSRKGATGQVVIYRLNGPENGTVKESQKRNSTESGTVPNLDGKSPVFPCKESRFSAKESQKRDTEPPEPSGTVRATKRKSAPASAVARPDEVSEQVWADWLSLRKAKKAPVTPTVLRNALSEATKAGLPLERFLEIWCLRGSQGLQADWLKPNERAGPQTRPSASANFRGKTYAGTPIDQLPPDLRDAARAAVGDG